MFPSTLFPRPAFPNQLFPGAGGTPSPTPPGTYGDGPFPGAAYPAALFPPALFPGSWSGVPTLPADLLEALAAYLDAQDALVSAFAGSASSPKFWADVAPLGIQLPLLVFAEHAEPERYESPDGSGTVGVVEEGEVELAVYAATKAQARQLRRALVAALDDAPLRFATGTLLYLRARRRQGALGPVPGPDGSDAWEDRATLRYQVGRTHAPNS